MYLIGTPDGCWVRWSAESLGNRAARALRLTPAAMDRVSRQVDSGAADRGRLVFDAQELADWLPGGTSAAAEVALCPEGCWVASALAGSTGDARFLVFVEHPAIGLAAALTEGRVLNPAVWLAHWRAGARQLLQLSQNQRHRLLLLDATEVRSQPEALRAALKARFALPLPTASAPEGSAPPAASEAPLAAALADWLAASHPDMQALYRELIASCDVLPGIEPQALAAPPLPWVPATGVVRDYYALRNAALDLEQVRQLHAAAAEQVQAQALACRALEQRLDEQGALLAQGQQELARMSVALEEAQAFGADRQERVDRAVQGLEALQAEFDQQRQQMEVLQAHLAQETAKAALSAQAFQQAHDRALALEEAMQAAHLQQARMSADHEAALQGLAHQHNLAQQSLVQHQTQAAQAQAEVQAREQAALDELAQRALQLAQLQAQLQQGQRDEAQRHQQAQAQTQKLQQALDQAELRLQALQEALSRLQAQHAELGRDSQAQVQQLHEVQEALEQSERRLQKESQRHASARKDAERHRLALEESQTQRQASEAHRGAVQAQLDAARQDLGAARQENAGLRQDLSRLQKAADTGKQALAALEREKQALLADAASLEKEAATLRKEGVQQAREAASRARDASQAQAALQLSRQEVEQAKAGLLFLKDPHEPSIGEARLLTARLEPPYGELTVAVRAVKSADRQVPEATIRLVEHHGHPGLAVFAQAGLPPLFEAWQESGREANRPYMLLVPSDEKCRPLVEAMGSDDWLLLLALARRIERELRARSPAMAPHWTGLAQRLLSQLRAMAPCLRHAGGEWLPADPGLLLRLRRVQWSTHDVDGVQLRWWPAQGGGRFAVLRGPAAPPLQSWPDRPDGTVPDEWVVPLSPTSTEKERTDWARLPRADRLFLAAILESWPELLVTLEPAGAQAAGGAPWLQSAALELRDLARRQLGPDGALRAALPQASLLRRAARRWRGRSAAASSGQP